LKEALKASFQIFELPLTPSCRKGAVKNKITPTLLFQIFFIGQILRDAKKYHAQYKAECVEKKQCPHYSLLIAKPSPRT
jgi:hypothetical protein